MVNFRDPAVIAQDSLMVAKFWHTLAGLYFWEFVTSLHYEWSVIRGRRPYRWTILIYSVARVGTLLTLILILVRMDVMHRYDCQVEDTIQFILGYMAIAAASLLIILRIVAVWNGNKLVIAIAISVWVANLGSLIQSAVRIRAAWEPEAGGCTTVNILTTKLTTITILITDVTLLLIALVGLLRLGFHEPSVLGLGHLMWKQGLIWLFLATISYVPLVVFVSLDLNVPLDYTFHLPATLMMSIAATRIHRSLSDFSSRCTDIAGLTNKRHPINFATSRTNWVPAQPISLGSVGSEVTENTTYEEYQIPQTGHALSISGEGSQRDKMAGLRLDHDVERGAEVEN